MNNTKERGAGHSVAFNPASQTRWHKWPCCATQHDRGRTNDAIMPKLTRADGRGDAQHATLCGTNGKLLAAAATSAHSWGSSRQKDTALETAGPEHLPVHLVDDHYG
mmetsp:Transcript_14141/g.40039  ORF Transcript_14141/g.40039 Transcript_14141/m.40039 type:complete len:107 (+) Transcript_14141:3-323(+)